MNRPNVVFVFADQWRAQDTGYAGNGQVATPHLDRLARESVNFTHAVSGWPVCSPWRGSLLTGQYPLTHGIFVNDVPLADSGTRLGEAFAQEGYDTAWIGKWHIDGHGRSGLHSARTPPRLRLLEDPGMHPRLQSLCLLRRKQQGEANLGRLRRHRPDARRAALSARKGWGQALSAGPFLGAATQSLRDRPGSVSPALST